VAQIPPYFLGKHTSSLVIAGAVPDAGGVLTDGATNAILATTDSVEINDDPDVENVTCLTQTRKNNVIIEGGVSVVITGKLLNAEASTWKDALGVTQTGNPITALCAQYDYFRIQLTRAGRTWDGYFLRGPYREQVQKGPVGFTLNLLPVDPGQANPTYTT